jgi:DNA-binding CsgD family transcriptional regulator
VLDDLHWSDPSGLDLFHFVSRQIAEVPMVLLGVYNTEQLVHSPAFQKMERALLSVSGSEALDVGPLSADETVDLVLRTFEVDAGIGEPLARQIHERAGGNPYFVEEILKSLVDSGKLFLQDGRWLGWEVEDLDLPASVTEAVSARFGELSAAAREVANVLAVAGTRVDHELLTTVAEQDEADILAGLDQLRTGQLIHEASAGAHIVYRFVHPLVQEVIYSEMGLARARTLHQRMGEALERGEAAVIDDPAHALAYHFSRAGGDDPRVVPYLAAAGRVALESRANSEAAGFLTEAIERVRAGAFTEEDTGVEILPLEEDLARVLQRLGQYRLAADHLKAALEIAIEREDSARAADLHRQIGQTSYFSGRFDEAVKSYTVGLEYAQAGADRAIEARLHLSKGNALQAQGSADEARKDMETALSVAETVGDPTLLTRVRYGLMILHIWLGNPDQAREQGTKAITLAEEAGDRQATFWVYWALAMGEGFLGEVEVMDRHIQRCREIAKELRSPVLDLWTSEVQLEHAMAAGEWNTGIALGERAVARARALGQDALLPRLLVWLSLIYLGRGEIERGRACVDEAWTLSGASTGDNSRVHLVLPAHIGKAAYHHAAGEYAEAIRVGEAGLAIAENTGFIIWAVHRLLPLIGEAYLQIHDAEAGIHIEQRMQRYGKKLNTRSGLAWLGAFEAIKVWYSGDIERGTVLMRKAAEDLEEVPMIYDAARLRRQLAGRLADLGQRDAALEELRRVHDVFQRIGAKPELKKTRGMFRELDARPPSTSQGSGSEALSQRELEIARLVARRKSNKAIAKELGISPRTVSTHLSNAFQKLEIGSRGELADYAREHSLLSGEGGG